MATCPRCYQPMLHTICAACGYPNLKPLVGWCRHHELRLVEYGGHQGKLECLICQARFDPHGEGVRFVWWVKHAKQYRWLRAPDDLDSYRRERRAIVDSEEKKAEAVAYYKTATPRTFYAVGFFKENPSCTYLVALLPDNDWAEPPPTGWGWATPALLKPTPAQFAQHYLQEWAVTVDGALSALRQRQYGQYLLTANLVVDKPRGVVRLIGDYDVRRAFCDAGLRRGLGRPWSQGTHSLLARKLQEELGALLPCGLTCTVTLGFNA